MVPIAKIAASVGLSVDDIEPYGPFTAKIRLSRLPDPNTPPRGKLILVTATTPTSQGEGKTVVSIGLAQALSRLHKKSIVTLREPSLGPVFGVKGGAAGGGRSEVLPREKINLHFNGDIHAVGSAHNLLAAMIDAHLHHGNELRLDVDNIFWPRAIDMNDRALRHIIVGLGGKANGVPRESGFVITAASEIMAILALAKSLDDCRNRLDDITIGFDLSGQRVRAADLKATGALMILLKDALMPNLVQTTEETPALIHAGPFANIAHGTSSVIAQKMALSLADYVVNETGFGADLGAEKFLDIVMPSAGLKPSVAVLITTVAGLRLQSQTRNNAKSQEISQEGLANLARHIENLKKYSLPTVIAINRHREDRKEDLDAIKNFSAALAVDAVVTDVFENGGSGGLELASRVIEAADKADLEKITPLVPRELDLKEKIELIAREIYGAASVHFESTARRKLDKFSALGFSKVPVCMAKTPSSFSDDPKKLGAPRGWTLTVTDAHLASGAGFVVVMAGNIMLMPGLPETPQAVKMGLDTAGKIFGLS
jgi:formate--tetrahydrofolate ligase